MNEEARHNQAMVFPRLAVGRLGSHPAVVWVVKHVVSPLDRIVVKISAGHLQPPSSLFVPTLLLTTKGRRSGQDRTTPLVYVDDGGRYVVANARPAGEGRNPWVLNLSAAGRGLVRVRGKTLAVAAGECDSAEAEEWWPRLVEVWPAFAEHYAATGDRTVFVLEPIAEGP